MSSRPLVAAALAVAVLGGPVAAGAVLLGACGSGGDDASAKPAGSTTTTTTTVPPVRIVGPELVAGAVGAQAVRAGDTLPPAAVEGTLAAVRRYVDTAVVQPLARGRSADGLEGLFDAALAPRLAPSGRDRGALTDELGAAADADVRTSATPVTVEGLLGGAGETALTSAVFTLKVQTALRGQPVTINRLTELVLAPTGAEYRIAGYQVQVTRETPAATTTTTAVAPATTVEP